MLKILMIKWHWFFSSQLGIDLLKFFHAFSRGLFFLKDYYKFRKCFQGEMTWMPCLHDRGDQSGASHGEYFWQDLLVAQWIAEAIPEKHVDVGSRVDGFVAHVASFRDIEVFDVRPINCPIPRVKFRTIDFMQEITLDSHGLGPDYCDSLSCLHVIEHFGLGRYGDEIDPQGYQRGIENLAKLLKPKGKLYLSTPIGRQRVEFNANWVFNPHTIIQTANQNALSLVELHVLNADGTGLQQVDLSELNLNILAQQPYHLGVFIFEKRALEPVYEVL
jgi:hypothetical protein